MPDKPIAPAADETLRILGFLARQRSAVPAATIAFALDIPRSSVYHLLATLRRHGFVVNGDRRWALGPAVHDLGSGYLRQQPLALVGRAVVSRLVDQLGENAHLAVLHGREVVYVIEERAPGRPSLVSDVGVRLPAHLTASGRAMLAQMTSEQILALYPDDAALVSRGERALTRRALREELRVTRARGYATERGDITEGLASIAAPILDGTGWPVASIAVTFAEPRDDWQVIADRVREAAVEIARRL